MPHISECVNQPFTKCVADTFRQELLERGYVEGKNFTFEFGFFPAERPELLPEIANDLIRRKVDLIVTVATPATRAVRQATSTIPIVMFDVGDPIGVGLVATLARPGGNVTGVTSMQPDAAGKRLELLKEVVPNASRVAIMWNPANAGNRLDVSATEVAARALVMTLHAIEVRTPNDFASAFSSMKQAHDDALMVSADPLIYNSVQQIVDLAATNKFPTIYSHSSFANAGGLMAYASNLAELWRRAGYFVDKILKGTKPADLPVQQPTKFELIINLKAAKALGLTVPPNLLTRADAVIE